MTPQAEFLELLCKTIKENCSINSEISLEELVADGSVYVELGEGILSTQYYDKSAIRTVSVHFYSSTEEQSGLEKLSNICNYFQTLKTYPQGEKVAWVDAAVAKEPFKTKRNNDEVYYYSCILNCKIYF